MLLFFLHVHSSFISQIFRDIVVVGLVAAVELYKYKWGSLEKELCRIW